MTCSPSFLRISPWSTNTQVELVADGAVHEQRGDRGVDAAAQAADDLGVADLVADARDLVLDDRGRRPRHVAAAHVAQEALEDVLPERRVHDLGVELDAVDPALFGLEGGHRRLARRGQRAEARRRGEDGVAMRHPAALLVRQPGQQPAVVGDGELGAAELAHLGALDAPAELERDELHPVTDAEDRDPELEQLRIELGRVVGVDRRRAAGEDQALGPAPRDLLGADVMGQQLAEHAALAHAAGDELGVLPAVVEDDDLVDGARDVERCALVRQLRAGGRSARARSIRPRPRRPWRRRRDPVRAGALSRRAPCQERRSLSGPHSAAVSAGALSAAGVPLPFGLSGCAEDAAPREPMPTPWEVCRDLPSVCSDGAIMSSARLNSARSL